MNNRYIIREFIDYSKLLQVKGEDSFKIRVYEKVIESLQVIDFDIDLDKLPQLQKINGIGKTTISKIESILKLGYLPQKNKLLEKIPLSILELFNISGLGPKKIKYIFEQMDIYSLDQLKVKCESKEILKLKGFTEKSITSLLNKINFHLSNKGKLLLNQGTEYIQKIVEYLDKLFQKHQLDIELAPIGEVARKENIINELQLLLGTDCDQKDIYKILSQDKLLSFNQAENTILDEESKVKIKIVPNIDFVHTQIVESSSAEWQKHLPPITQHIQSEKEYFKQISMPYILPEMRRKEYLTAWQKGDFNADDYINIENLRGCIHNHSIWSDGKNTISEMATHCQEIINLEYYANCDHSKSAFYANGLSEEKVLQQHEEINALNNKNNDFLILKGIEVDILANGDLDYEDDFLRTFDLVLASVHTGLDMNKEHATQRLIKAIENPYIHILGHPTGRLLLRRQGYELDFEKIIDACAINQVAIELNANPKRLDLDFSYIKQATDRGVMISINPDAHSLEGLWNLQYGIWVARKGGLKKEFCLNALPQSEFLHWLKK